MNPELWDLAVLFRWTLRFGGGLFTEGYIVSNGKILPSDFLAVFLDIKVLTIVN